MPFPVPFSRSLDTSFESEQVFLSAALLIDSLVRTLQVGSLYALMALGLTLTMAVIKLPNFAHAELITVGAYAALVMSMAVSSNPFLVLATAFIVSALVALLCHRVVYRPLAKVNPSMYTMILASFAVGLDPPLHHLSVG